MPALFTAQHSPAQHSRAPYSPAQLQVPRHDLLPATVQRAELIRGTLVPCGPGLRGVGWPDTPLVRAAALAPWFSPHRTALLLTAAWVWGAAHAPGVPLEFASAARAGRSDEYGVPVRSRQLQAPDERVHLLGTRRVTTPVATVADLLRLSTQLTRAHLIACRVLAAYCAASAERVAAELAAGPAPHRRRAYARLAKLNSVPGWIEDAPEMPTSS